MTKTLLIAQREVKHFFQTPFAMVIVTIYLVMCGVYFSSEVDKYLTLTNPSDTTVQVVGATVNKHLLLPFFGSIFNLLLFFIPLITMRSFAEEKKMATYDLLVSYPIKPWEIILGKYLGTLTLVLGMLGWSFLYVLVILFKGHPYMPEVYTAYLGYFCFIIFYTAVGIVASLSTENQIVAAIVTYLALLGTAIIQWLAYVTPAPWDKFFAHFLLLSHIQTFVSGTIFSGDIVAYLSVTAVFLLIGYLKIRKHYYSL
jgi:ABC-2 type transport system permease protein